MNQVNLEGPTKVKLKHSKLNITHSPWKCVGNEKICLFSSAVGWIVGLVSEKLIAILIKVNAEMYYS